MWRIGLSDSRFAFFAVGSPKKFATHPWLTSLQDDRRQQGYVEVIGVEHRGFRLVVRSGCALWYSRFSDVTATAV